MVVNCPRRRMSRQRRRNLDCRVFLNGAEVTVDCFYADTRRRRVLVLLRNEAGARFVDLVTRRAAWIERRGRVRIVLP